MSSNFDFLRFESALSCCFISIEFITEGALFVALELVVLPVIIVCLLFTVPDPSLSSTIGLSSTQGNDVTFHSPPATICLQWVVGE